MQSQLLHTLMTNSGVGFGTSGVRGLVADMTDELCSAYTSAFLQTVAGSADKVVLGHDLRPSSPSIAAACAIAIRDAGLDLVFAGALPTPALAYYAKQLGAPAIIVTGSHIPFDRNGIKFYSANGEISKAQEQTMLETLITIPSQLKKVELPKPNSYARLSYLERYLSFFGKGVLTGMRVAVYEHSSVGRDVLREILEALGAKVIALGRSDHFVPIDTEAVRPEDVAQAKQWAQDYTFDAIVTTDGDADRPLIGDEQGQWLRGDIVGILCAQYLHAQIVVAPVSCNTALEQSNLFATVLRTRIGSPYVIAGMEEAHGKSDTLVVGYEANGGFLLGSDVLENGHLLSALPTRDAILPILALLCSAHKQGCKISGLARTLPARYTASDRLEQFPAAISTQLLSRLQADKTIAARISAPDAGELVQTDMTDGLRMTFANGDIVHLRPSGNAPELRCYAEADSAERALQLCKDCLLRLSAWR